eukprot:scaffold127163_cov21-Tisochrysis_lutea.AAC.1
MERVLVVDDALVEASNSHITSQHGSTRALKGTIVSRLVLSQCPRALDNLVIAPACGCIMPPALAHASARTHARTFIHSPCKCFRSPGTCVVQLCEKEKEGKGGRESSGTNRPVSNLHLDSSPSYVYLWQGLQVMV